MSNLKGNISLPSFISLVASNISVDLVSAIAGEFQSEKIFKRYSNGASYKRLLGESFNSQITLQQEIILDFVLDTINFAAAEGMPWKCVHLSALFSANLMLDLISQGMNIKTALDAYKCNLVKFTHLTSVEVAKSICTFHAEHVFLHFKLFSHCLSSGRELHATQLSAMVYPVNDVPSLNDSVTLEEWQYQQQCHEASARYDERLAREDLQHSKNLELLQANRMEKMEEMKQVVGDSNNNSISKAEIGDILKKLVLAESELLTKEMDKKLNCSKLTLDHNLEQTQLRQSYPKK